MASSDMASIQRLRAAGAALALVGFLGAVPGIANESNSDPYTAFLVVATIELALWSAGLALIVRRMIGRGGLLASGRGGWLFNSSQFLIVAGFGIAGIVLTTSRGLTFYLVVAALVVGLIGLAAWTHLYAVATAKEQV